MDKEKFRLDKDLLGKFANHHHNKDYRDFHRETYPITNGLVKADKGVPCMRCERDDQIFPSLNVILCPACTMKLHPRTVKKVADDVYLNNDGPACFFCESRKIRMYKVQGQICQKCTVKIAENVRGNEKNKRRRFRFE